jgi:DNA-directed RNA polymerase specialized sigma24 family protein
VSCLTNDPGDAPDVVQGFFKVFRNVQSFRGQSSLKTWIYRIAVNESRNHRRWFGGIAARSRWNRHAASAQLFGLVAGSARSPWNSPSS